MSGTTERFARTCTHCGKGINEGYLTSPGMVQDCYCGAGACFDAMELAASSAGYETAEEAFEDGWYFWTAWDPETDCGEGE